jgi:hypothetical protein
VTYEQFNSRIRHLEFELEKADFGMGMPRDAERVAELCKQLDDLCKEYVAEVAS